MKQLTCEMCGSTDLMKQDGVFVCQTCGCKYSVEEAKKMMIEGAVEVTGSVKVDASEKVQNLYVMARRARDDNNDELAAKYYEMILVERPNDWEALFYFNYFKAKNANWDNMEHSVTSLSNSLDQVFDSIDKTAVNSVERMIAMTQIVTDTFAFRSLIRSAKSFYEKNRSGAILISDLINRAHAIANLQKKTADLSEKYMSADSGVAHLLKQYVENYLLPDVLSSKYIDLILEQNSKELVGAETRIKAIDPNYESLIDKINKEKQEEDEAAKKAWEKEVADEAQNNAEMIQVNYQVGHYGVSNQWYSSPNSVGGNTVRYAIKNIGTKPIKYYHLCFAPYNSVGDKVKCSISNDSEKWLKGTGPIAPNGISGECYLENAWYNSSITSVKLVKAEIEYTDGTRKTILGDKITSIANSNSNTKVCAVSGGIVGAVLGVALCMGLSISPSDFGLFGFGALVLLGVIIGAIIGACIEKKKGKNGTQNKQQEEIGKKEIENKQKDNDNSKENNASGTTNLNENKKSKKKIGIICLSAITVIIAMIVAISIWSNRVDKKTNSRVDSQLAFTLNDNGESYSVTGIGTSTDTDVVIPSVYNGKPVTDIGEMAFENCRMLRSIVIPNGVTSIGYAAFRGCDRLTCIVIPYSVMSIGAVAFPSSSNIFYEGNSAADWNQIDIDGGIYGEVLEGYDVYNSYKVYYYAETLPTTPGNFWHWLDGVPKTYEDLGTYETDDLDFSGNTDSQVTPETNDSSSEESDGSQKTPPTNGSSSQESNASQETPSISSSGPQGNIDSQQTAINELAFDLNDDGKSYSVAGIGTATDQHIVIPSDYQGKPVTNIKAYAFSYCDSLTSIVIPNSVTSIDYSAFYACESLTSITIPNSVTSIGDYAFACCYSLTNAVISNGVTSVGKETFAYCNKLKSVVIPSSVTSIGAGAFYNCGLTQVFYVGSSADWWNKVRIEDGNYPLNSATIYYYMETKPTETGNFWHWSGSVPKAW